MSGNIWIVVVSSAVGVFVSGVLTLVGQYLERRSRRDELLLSRAIEVATKKSENALKASAQNPYIGAWLVDDVINAEKYYRWLKSLLDNGRLPPDADNERPK
jgi:hypothetical protein